MCCIDDRKAFDRAATKFAAQEDRSNSIATMMRLSVEAKNSSLRRWASEWLFKHCNVRVIMDEPGVSHAAPSKAAGIC